MLKPITTLAAAAWVAIAAVMPFDPVFACSTPPVPVIPSGPHCKIGSTIVINKPVSIYKPVTINNPVTINKDVNIYKPVTIQKDVSVYAPVTIDKNVDIQNNVDIQKSVDINKNIDIEKSITINNGGSASAMATANAAASSGSGATAASEAQAFASSFGGAQAGGATYYGSYFEDTVAYRGVGGDIGNAAGSDVCEMQDATVVKAIHAVCVAPDGREFPASHMTASTFIDSSYEGEVARCIPGARLKIAIGDVLQSDQGMAGTYEHGATLICGEHEAVRHYKNGMLKCELAVPVKDCTERTNLRKYGTGDMFFSYRTKVCATPARAAARAVEVTGMSLEGGVGADR